ncbi:MAG: hypothetical protein FJ135_13330 [Deltaproteobacteria bacterium]|nr:hypothetical protein [Deltaproteobacteria bacterium]
MKVHLFGTSKYDYLVKLPIFSCDSTTGAKMGAYGSILYWNPHKNNVDKTEAIYVDEFVHNPPKRRHYLATYAFRSELQNYLATTLGIGFDHFYGPEGHFYKQLVNLDFMAKLENRVNALKKE